MKILVVSYFYFPENSPRAFRATELVNEFSRRGFEVTLVLPNKEEYNDNLFDNKNLTVYRVGKLIKKSTGKITFRNPVTNNIKTYFSKLKYYFFPLASFGSFVNDASKKIIELDDSFDIIFSNSFPFITHLSLSKAFKIKPKLKENTVKIAEYSDPFYFQKFKRINIYYKFLEKRVLKDFDYISIPTELARNYYLYFKEESKIKILPQAYNLDNTKISDYIKNNIPTFAYAGMFYPGMRDPSFLFEYLIETKERFKFIIYTRFSNDFFIVRYKEQLKDKLEVRENYNREQIIYDLSQVDFLINIENDSENQLPSKLIDYAIAERPIFSANKNNFDPQKFKQFLNFNFDGQLSIDLTKHNIKNIVDQIINLKLTK